MGFSDGSVGQHCLVYNIGMSYIGTKDWGVEVSEGNVSGASLVHKFGAAPDFDTGDNEVTIWDGAEDGTTWEQMVYTYSATADIQYISSENAGDTETIEVQGLDTNYDLVTQTKDLTGQTSATLDTALIRIFRMKNIGSTDLAGHVFCSTTTAPAGGVPTAANIRAMIHVGNNQTEMAVYTVPNGKTAHMRSFYSSTAGASRSAEYSMKLKVRPFGQVFQLKHRWVLIDDTWVSEHHSYREPQSFPAKTDIEITGQVLTAAITGVNLIAGFDMVLIDD